MGLGPTTNDRVTAVITANAASLLRIARLHSLCADDAQDAYQRALLIYLERVDRIDDATAGQWLRTVCKHEAMKIRDQRRRVLPADEPRWDAQPSLDARDADERASSLERVARAAEALQGCKPDEATAMLLKADGSSYAEIGALTGWSRTKVNRSLAEGRARFLRRFGDIESGAACDGWSAVLSAIVDGEAAPDDLARVRPHLRHCSPCRATLRALTDSQPALGALVPAGTLGGAAAASGVVARAWEALVAGAGERLVRLQAAVEALTSTKAVAVVASTAAVAAGGSAAVRPEPAHREVRRPVVTRTAQVRQSRAPRSAPLGAAAAVTTGRPRPAPPVAPTSRASAPPPPVRIASAAAPEFASAPRAPAPAPPLAAPARAEAAAAPSRPSGGEFGFEG
jgi:RNA polymerase sigma factor (sigma-70 family)